MVKASFITSWGLICLLPVTAHLRAKQQRSFQTDVFDINQTHQVGASWVYCANQWEVCECGSKVRWGNSKTWQVIEPKSASSMNTVSCSINDLPDVVPGDPNKHCECEAVPGTSYYTGLNTMLLQAADAEATGSRLIASCDIFESKKDQGEANAALWSAVEPFCSADWEKSANADPTLKPGSRQIPLENLRKMMQARIDARFVKNYGKFVNKDGWIPKAFINYFKSPPSGKHALMTEELIKSIHMFSQAPIVVFHYGGTTPASWTAEKYPRLILLHALPMNQSDGRSFNYNKFRSILLSRVLAGVQLDSDQFVGPGVDDMFKMTEREITKEYPYPILPVHFTSFDRENTPKNVWWKRYCNSQGCERHTMRWSHAHPTWDFWALPFFGRWLRRHFRDETLPPLSGQPASTALRVADIPEDEDLLNVGAWEEKLTKQWCKYDNDYAEFTDMLSYTPSSGSTCFGSMGCTNIAPDPKFYPVGAAKAFYTAHNCKNPSETKSILAQINAHYKAGTYPTSTIVYNSQFQESGLSLRKHFPDLKCIF